MTIAATQVITYTPGPPTGEPREGGCWTNSLVILGNLQTGMVWTAHWAVVMGGMPNLTIMESAMVPVRTIWR